MKLTKRAAATAGTIALAGAFAGGFAGTARADATPAQVKACATALVSYANAHGGISSVENLFVNTGGQGIAAHVGAAVPACKFTGSTANADLEQAALQAYTTYSASLPALSASASASIQPCETALAAEVKAQGAPQVVRAVASGSYPAACSSLATALKQAAVQKVLSGTNLSTVTPSATAAPSTAVTPATAVTPGTGTATTAAPATGGGTGPGEGLWVVLGGVLLVLAGGITAGVRWLRSRA